MKKIQNISVNTSRELNVFRLLSCLHNTPKLTVNELCEQTTIPQPTVYRLVHQLLEGGLLIETAKLDTPNGRKATLYSINPSFACYINVVLEKSAIALNVSDLSGTIIRSKHLQPKLPLDRTAYLNILTGALDALLSDLETYGIPRQRILLLGVAAEADTDRESGKIIQFSGLHCLDDFNIVAFLQTRYGIRSILEKHLMIEAASSIDKTLGHACQNYVYLHIGTGIGASVVIDGKHYLGANGKAGELVRIRRENGETWEDAFNTANLYQQLMQLSTATTDSTLKDILFSELAAPSEGTHIHPLMRVIEYALRLENREVQTLVASAAAGWAQMITALHAFYDPSVVIVGGDVSASTPEVFGILQHVLDGTSYFDGRVLPLDYSIPPEQSISRWFLNDAFLQIFAGGSKEGVS